MGGRAMSRTAERVILLILLNITSVFCFAEESIIVDLKPIISGEKGVRGQAYEYNDSLYFIHDIKTDTRELGWIDFIKKIVNASPENVKSVLTIDGRYGDSLFIYSKILKYNEQFKEDMRVGFQYLSFNMNTNSFECFTSPVNP